MNTFDLTNLIKNKSQKLGFNLVGVTSPHIIKNNLLDKWIDKKYHASMSWMENRMEERKDIFKYFPEVKSIISFGYNYYTGQNKLDNKNFKISNYAWGEDYHLVIKKKLFLIIEDLKNIYPDLKFRVCVDTSPVSEKYWGEQAGLGWIGKHTNLINNNMGSWFFLSEILLDVELDYDDPFLKDLCGNCTKCIDKCPTSALDEYVLDSNKCISYLTIEHRGEINENFHDKLDGWIYGCDICQQVCPWNIKFSLQSEDQSFVKRKKIKDMDNEKWENLSIKQYREIFKKSAIKRTKFEGIKRNIKLNK